MNIESYIEQIEQQQKEQDAIYHNLAVRYGMSDTVMWVLYMISSPEVAYTQQELCRQCFFPKQTINSAITNLVRNGYVELETIPGTRNHKKIILTSKGRELAANTTDVLQEAERRAYAKFTEAELNAYLEMTAKLTVYLREEIEK